MATTISTQDLENARRDIDDIGKAVNEKVIVTPRYGAPFKSIPMTVAELQAAIEAAAAAGAGSNGWTDLLIQTQDGTTQRAKNLSFQSQIDSKASTIYVDAQVAVKADKSYVDAQDANLQTQINEKATSAYLDNALDEQTQTVNTALSQLSTAANKFYPTLAEANADIANITVNQPVTVGAAVNGGLYHKATAGATSLTKSPYDPIEQAKSYTDLYARSSAYDNTRHLDTYEKEGRYTFRFLVDATTAKGFPPESVGKLGFFEVFRNGTDSTVVQKITVEATLVLYRKKSDGVWESKWRLAKRVQDISTPTNLLTFALAQKDYTVATVRTNIGTLANGYPYEGAQGTVEVFANDDWPAKTIRFTSVNRQTWICTYRDNTGTGTWSEWVRLDYNDGGIFGILDKAKTTLFDFNDIASVDAATLNVPIKITYSESNLTQVQPYVGLSSPTAVLSTVGGGTALTSIASGSDAGQYKTTVNLLTAVNQTLAIAFYHDDTSTAVDSIFSQTAAGQAGRLQIAANCYYTGSKLDYEKDSLCVFLGGASEGSGLNGSVKKGQLLKGWNTLILQIGDGSKASKLLVNGKLTDTFTSTIYNTESVIFPALVSDGKSMAKIGRIVSYKGILSDEAIDQLQEWLIKSYKAPDKSPILSQDLSRNPVKHTAINGVTLSSSLAAGCMLASDDGSYMSRDVLYSFNQDAQLTIYSVTKIMTFMVLMDMQPSLNEVLTRTEFDPAIGSGANLGVGDQIYLRDALYNLMLPSSNVSARIIARTYGHKLLIKDGVTGGTDTQAVARWVTQMNAKAAEIGMTNTTYTTPDGNGADISTVIDLLKKGNYALKYPLLNKVWNTKSYTLDVFGQNPRAITVTNSNTLLDNDYTIGGKSGSADVTNLVSIHHLPDLQKLVTVVLHATTTQDRNADTMSMVNVALSRYS